MTISRRRLILTVPAGISVTLAPVGRLSARTADRYRAWMLSNDKTAMSLPGLPKLADCADLDNEIERLEKQAAELMNSTPSWLSPYVEAWNNDRERILQKLRIAKQALEEGDNELLNASVDLLVSTTDVVLAFAKFSNPYLVAVQVTWNIAVGPGINLVQMGMAGEKQDKVEVSWRVAQMGAGRYFSAFELVGKETGIVGKALNFLSVVAVLKASYQVGVKWSNRTEVRSRLEVLEMDTKELNNTVKLQDNLRIQLLNQAAAIRLLKGGFGDDCRADDFEIIDPVARLTATPLAMV